MIEVVIRHQGSGVELAKIEIENTSPEADDLGDYSVRFGVERIGAVGVHQRSVLNFPRTRYNVLALLRQALETLEPEELELSGDYQARSYKRNHMLELIRGWRKN